MIDQHSIHHSKAVRAWLAEKSELYLMPGYRPELNHDELLDAASVYGSLLRAWHHR
ncbi:transposase [Streptomyces zingiberis]|uniref:Tc1-like transposase DDE domain-containing protein n=1 Tax=Streptomyces zingiberis TaxID=2053010 RepID=A0ABX1BZW7_9ACTN|nr:transposase [Streptomyces zingiberis]NJQ01237.1 hypothetical protein [Streptomyces zingiberis]